MYTVMRLPSVVEELMPFVCLNSNDFSSLSHNLLINIMNAMKLILSIHDYSVMMDVQVHEEAICCRGVIALYRLNFNGFVSSEP